MTPDTNHRPPKRPDSSVESQKKHNEGSIIYSKEMKKAKKLLNKSVDKPGNLYDRVV